MDTHSIEVTTSLEISDGRSSQEQYTVVGTVTGNQDDFTLTYHELGKTLETILHVTDGKRITVMRLNELNAFFIIEKNVTHKSHFKLLNNTSYVFNIKGVDIAADYEKGILTFSYLMDMNMTTVRKLSFEYIFTKL